MAPTLVSLPPRNAVAERSRKLHRVRRSILTHPDRYGKGCYHQGESMFSGASLPPHLGVRRLSANMGWKHNNACQCSKASKNMFADVLYVSIAQGTQWIKVSLPIFKQCCASDRASCFRLKRLSLTSTQQPSSYPEVHQGKQQAWQPVRHRVQGPCQPCHYLWRGEG
jgi:hypothetical protein